MGSQIRMKIHHILGWVLRPLSSLSLVAQLVRNPPAMQETPGQFLGWEDPLEKGWATHSSILGFPWWLSWKRICLKCWIPGFDSWVEKIPWRKERLLTPVFWPGEFHGLYSRGVTKSWRQLSNFCFLSIYLLDLAGLYICCWVSQMAPVLKTCLPMQET